MNKYLVIVLILLLVVGGGVGIWLAMKKPVVSPESGLTTPTTTSPSTTTTVAATPTATSTTTPTGKIVEVTIEASPFKFSQSTIKAKKGDTVKITFKVASGIHDFVIDEYEVATNQIGEGEEEEIEFVADKAGTFEYYCSVSNHRAMGMTGKLVVE